MVDSESYDKAIKFIFTDIEGGGGKKKRIPVSSQSFFFFWNRPNIKIELLCGVSVYQQAG